MNNVLINILKFCCFQKSFLFNKTIKLKTNHSFFKISVDHTLYVAIPTPKSFTYICEIDFTYILYYVYSKIKTKFYIQNKHKKEIIEQVITKNKKQSIFILFLEKNIKKILIILLILHFYKKFKKRIEINKIKNKILFDNLAFYLKYPYFLNFLI
jgi:hypothetical protein